MTKPHVQRLLGAASLILAGCASVALASQAPPSKASVQPTTDSSRLLLGFPFQLGHYDHHWYWWLPRHPTFEAVEVMSAARPGGGPPLVSVFFTERAGGKRQHHYINDARIAASRGSTYRDIRFDTTGATGEAQTLTVSFADADGKPVELAMQFEPGTQLLRSARTGLTDQSGHMARTLFLLFYRDTAARGSSGTVKIGGVNHAFLPDEPGHPVRYANSANIYVGTIAYGHHLIPSGAAVQPRPGGGTVHTSRNRRGNLSMLTFDAADALLETRHSDGPSSMFTTYRPALPPCSAQTAPARSHFSISIDSDSDLIVGEATRRCDGGGSIIEYRPTSPGWAAAQPFSVRQTLSPDGAGTLLTAQPLPR